MGAGTRGRPPSPATLARVYLLLPPSETKSVGGDRIPLDLGRLSFPELTVDRFDLVHALVALSTDLPTARKAIGVSAALDHEVAANTLITSGPTLPALRRYTGVLYDALDAGTFRPAERGRAADRLLITSALFGLLRPADRIPSYRLSAGSALPSRPTIPAHWRPAMTRVLGGLDGLVIDLRSGAYAAFGPAPGAIAVRVVTEAPDGSRSVVSHFSKATKGGLARALATTRADVTDLAGALRILRRAGFRVERTGPASFDVLT